MKNYVFKIVVEDDEHEDGRPAFRAYCPALESIGAATWGDTREEAVKHIGEVRIPCLILYLANVKRVCQCRAPHAPCGVHGRMASVMIQDTSCPRQSHKGMSRPLLKLSGGSVDDYATISDDSPIPS